MIYFKANNTEYPAQISGKVSDRDWDGRSSKSITLTMEHAAAAQLFTDGLVWSIIQREPMPIYGEDGKPTGETTEFVQEWDNSDYIVAGQIIDHRDGTVTVKMGTKTASDILSELEEAYDAG